MRFTNLRIVGFKSFVDPVDIAIEPGLTGIVGPNGCGKSNLLEALRWVMGANSAKAMRAGGMDDVIFSGSAVRPARNHAEAGLVIDNSDRSAPAQFNDADELDVTRRITRGGGSTYRVNGRETRARDVQLLFADASSGANSPALVRQGQINELISAKPQNRRKVLEEAAGVAGLYSRRHEAELRLRGAETNLERLDDLMGENERRLDALRRQARQANRYKKVSLEIRTLETRVHLARWNDAKDAAGDSERALADAVAAVEAQTRDAAAAASRAAKSASLLEPARKEEAVASALLARLSNARERMLAEAEAARAEVERLAQRNGEIQADIGRETERLNDATGAGARIAEQLGSLDVAPDGEAEELRRRESDWREADAARRSADDALEEASRASAADEARRDAALREERRLSQGLETLERRLATRMQLDAESETGLSEDALNALRTKAAESDEALAAARSAADAGETARDAAETSAARATSAHHDAERALARVQAEADALATFDNAEQDGAWTPVSDEIRVEPGYDAALAAALGDDLAASRGKDAPARWTGVSATGVPPAGTQPLSAMVEAPTELAARLDSIGLVSRDDAEQLAANLSPGQRLVTREGDLWRWDGLYRNASAVTGAVARLQRKARLETLARDIKKLSGKASRTSKKCDAAKAQLDICATARVKARENLAGCETVARDAARAFDRAQAQARASAEKQAARAEALISLQQDRDAAAAQLAAARKTLAGLPDPALATDALESERKHADATRGAAAEARAAFESVRRDIQSGHDLAARLKAECIEWEGREKNAAAQIEALKARVAETADRLVKANVAPKTIETRIAGVADEHSAAEKRRRNAGDGLAVAEKHAKDADQAARETERVLAAARETRAGCDARLAAARDRVEDAADRAREALGVEPEAVETERDDAAAIDAEAAEKRLEKLRNERERLGAVNLRAAEEVDEQLAELEQVNADRDDLLSAITKLRRGVNTLNEEGRARLLTAFEEIDAHFRRLFETLFGGGEARLALVDSDDPLEAGLDIHVSPPGKKLGSLSLMSGGEQALTATALIFAVFLANPAPLCALDEVDAPLDDANVDRFCRLLDEMRRLTDTRFWVITHNAVTMSRMDRLYGVTMAEHGVSQLVSVDLARAEELAATA